MWDEADRRGPLPSRERDEPRDHRRDDRRDDRNRRYRSRSPHDSRGGRGGDRDRDRDRRRDDRDRDGRDYRGSGRGHDDRNGRREDDRTRDRGKLARDVFSSGLALRRRSDVGVEDSGRDKPRQRSRDRERDRDAGRRVTRSRSPRRERDLNDRKIGETGADYIAEKESNKVLPPEEEPTKSRTATPPVSFKVAAPSAQDHDQMDVDSGRTGNKKSKGKAKAAQESIEDDDEIVVEDDGMAAMQAMMGFGGFATTQNKKVAGNDISAVRKEKKTEYRQYMNRVGGFNRPLSPTRD